MRNILGAFLCVVMLVACGDEPTPTAIVQPTVEVVDETTDAFLEGSLSKSMNISGYGNLTYNYSNSNMVSMTVTMETDANRVVMAILTLEGGGLEHDDLAVGKAHSLAAGVETEGGLSFNFIGCEGERLDNFDYDDHADVIDVHVTQPEPEARRIHYTGTFMDPYSNEVTDILGGYIDVDARY